MFGESYEKSMGEYGVLHKMFCSLYTLLKFGKCIFAECMIALHPEMEKLISRPSFCRIFKIWKESEKVAMLLLLHVCKLALEAIQSHDSTLRKSQCLMHQV